MQIEEAEEKIKELLNLTNWYHDYGYREAIETVFNELEKKDKVIDEILNKFIEGTGYYYSEFDYMSKEEIKEYFYKKVSDNK